MKTLRSLLLAALLTVLLLPVLAAAQDELPTSPKAETLMANARPRVERQLAAKGLHLGSPIFLRVFKQSKQIEVWLRQE